MALSFSVITPSFNQGQFLERTILSVLSQGDVNFNYLVMDGGSSDNTIDLLRRYENKLDWVSQKDEGQSDAIIKGIWSTSGDIIAWINSDDIYYPSTFKVVREIFETHPNVQVVYGQANHIDTEDSIIAKYPTEPWNYKRLKNYCFICQPATFFRRRLVELYGGPKKEFDFCMDYELWLRYGQHTDFFYSQDILAGSRLHESTKTLSQRVNVHYEINEMLKTMLGHSTDKWIISYALTMVQERNKENTFEENLNGQINKLEVFLSEVVKGYKRWKNIDSTPRILRRISVWLASVSWRAICRFLIGKN